MLKHKLLIYRVYTSTGIPQNCVEKRTTASNAMKGSSGFNFEFKLNEQVMKLHGNNIDMAVNMANVSVFGSEVFDFYQLLVGNGTVITIDKREYDFIKQSLDWKPVPTAPPDSF